MRIAVHIGTRIWGGQERAVVRLMAGLRDRGHDVVLLCNSDAVLERAQAAGISARRCVIGGDAMVSHSIRLAIELRRIQPDVFLIGTYKKLFLAALGARLARVPRTVMRVGLESHTPKNAKYRIALRWWTDGVVVIARRLVAPYAELDGFGRDKVALIHNGVRKPTAQKPPRSVRNELSIPRDAFVVGCVARLDSMKRLDRMIDAVAQLPEDVHCLIAGGGTEEKFLRDRATTAGIENRVHFAGEREDIGDVLSALDVYVVSSDREGHSNSMLEAMSFGIPVVSTPVAGAEDSLAVPDSAAGIITDFSVESIRDGVRLLYENRELRHTLGAAAARLAETRFSFDVMLDQWEAFLGATLDSSTPTRYA